MVIDGINMGKHKKVKKHNEKKKQKKNAKVRKKKVVTRPT